MTGAETETSETIDKFRAVYWLGCWIVYAYSPASLNKYAFMRCVMHLGVENPHSLVDVWMPFWCLLIVNEGDAVLKIKIE